VLGVHGSTTNTEIQAPKSRLLLLLLLLLPLLRNNTVRFVPWPPITEEAYLYTWKSRDSSVIQYWGTAWMVGGSIPGRGWEFFHHSVQTGPGAHPASYPVSTRGFFPGGKAVGA
jgi:hypothetical protein